MIHYVQRRRNPGYNMQAQSTNGLPVKACTKPGKFGNPFIAGYQYVINGNTYRPKDAYQATLLYAYALHNGLDVVPPLAETIKELSGHNLSCFCEHGEWCHVQHVLVPLMNRPRTLPKHYFENLVVDLITPDRPMAVTIRETPKIPLCLLVEAGILEPIQDPLPHYNALLEAAERLDSRNI